MDRKLWDERATRDLRKFLDNSLQVYGNLLSMARKESVRNPKKIRHLQQVIEELRTRNKDFTINVYPPSSKPVCKGLLEVGKNNGVKLPKKPQEILEFLGKHHEKLNWQYGYRDLPRRLQQSFAFGEILGSQAPITPGKITLGFVLLAPNTCYPKHVHKGAEEIYINLGDACGINDQKVFPGESYHVLSGLPHWIQSPKERMGILLYTWTFPAGSPGDYDLRFLE